MFSKEVRNTLKIAWPLLVGIFFIMLGNGLQGTLLGLRATVEGFPLYATGLIMSSYYIGFLIGCIIVPKLIQSVGHIRVFAGFASLASTTILFHGMFVDPLTWIAIRAIGGFSFVGLFVVAESWLNSIAPNKLRSQIFSAYLFVVHGGLFLGQFFINLVPVEQIELFILVSVLVSCSLLPITLANRPAPGYEEPEHMPMKKILQFSSLPLIGIFTAGLTGTVIISMGPIYALQSGMKGAQISLFVGSYVLGATIIPSFIGWLADRFDRRQMILLITVWALAATCVILGLDAFILTMVFLLGGLIASLYSISIAYVNDNLKPSQITSVSASLIMLNGIGCCIGPFLTGVLIDIFNKDALFWVVAAMFSITLVIGIYKLFRGRKLRIEDQQDFVNMPARSSIMVAQMAERD